MSIVKKYNNELGQWEPVASDDATGIFTNNTRLTGLTDGGDLSVEDVLLRHENKFEKIEKNISWLALHGGGGSGYGVGGSSSFDIEIYSVSDNTTILSNKSTTGQIIWSNTISGIYYAVKSKSSSKFNVQIKINGTVVGSASNIKKNEKKFIASSALGIKNKDVTLQIVATDESDTEETATCYIKIASVTLERATQTITMTELQNSSPEVTINFRTTIPGRYYLYFSKSTIRRDSNGRYIDADGTDLIQALQFVELNLNTNSSVYRMNITDVLGDGTISLLNKDAVKGSYVRYMVLACIDESEVFSEVKTIQINVIITSSLLVSTLIGNDPNNPFSITADGIFNLRFVVFSNNSSTYSYSITCTTPDNIVHSIGGTVTGQIYGTYITVPITISNYTSDIFTSLGDTYRIDITAVQGGLSDTGHSYIQVKEATTQPITAYLQDISRDTIFDFTFWSNAGIVGADSIESKNEHVEGVERSGYFFSGSSRYDTLKQTLYLHNIGADSGMSKDSYSGAYSFNHTAFGVIKSGNYRWFPVNINDSSSLITGSSYQFTLSVAYHIDKDPSLDSTILNIGDYNPDTNLGSGILLTSHNYYIKIENTYLSGILQDGAFSQIDIVSTLISTKLWIYVYQDGKLLNAKELIRSSNGGGSFSGFNQITLACRNYREEGGIFLVENNVNLHLYSVKLFSTALNTGQIVCSYINNYINYKRKLTNDNSYVLDGDLLETLLKNNGIKADADVQRLENGQYDTRFISSIYNMSSGDFTWNAVTENGIIKIPDTLQNLPIPVITLAVDWTFDQFTDTNATLTSSTNSRFEYRFGEQSVVVGDNGIEGVKADIQGTTTAKYNIKNIKIEFPEGILFSPKSEWFPESSFTLKADVVDSGHLNNAVIGRFVNDCFNKTDLLNLSGGFPVKSIVENYKNQSGGGDLPSSFTMKAAIEGFPVLLITSFKNGDTREVRVLGIYSFNLGRESYYNQGYKIPKHLYNIGDTVNPIPSTSATFPGLFATPPGADVDNTYEAYCYEGKRSFNNKVQEVTEINDPNVIYDYAEVWDGNEWKQYPSVVNNGGIIRCNSTDLVNINNQPISWSSANLKLYKVLPDGYFWSNDYTYATQLWTRIYASGQGTTADSQFRQLNTCIATKLEYHKGSVTRVYNTTLDKYIISNTGDNEDAPVDTSKSNTETFTLTAPQAKEGIELSVKNAAFYYCVCMLFGLVDNLGKNLQFKKWYRGDAETFWSPTFYDMDTAMGLDNNGGETVPPTVFDESIINTPDNRVALMFGKARQSTNGVYTVYSNKLWGGLESEAFFRQYSLDYGSESNWKVYSSMWSDIRTTVIKDVDSFIEDYFTTQLSRCGELLFNYDYQVKYLSTSQSDMLHGTRQTFLRNWMKSRIKFLDSVFGYNLSRNTGNTSSLENLYLNSNNINIYPVSWKSQVNIVHNSGVKTIPILTNDSIIIRTKIGNSSTSYTYVPKNTETEIIVADSLATQNIQTLINNSDCILDFPDLQSLDVLNIIPQLMGKVKDSSGNQKYNTGDGNIDNQYGGLSSIKNFNLSGIKTINSNINLFQLFKTWDSSGYDVDPLAFSLQTIDFSRVESGKNMTAIFSGESFSGIPSIYTAPFKNLIEIDVSDSDISSIVIPEGVSLFRLNIRNSSIQNLELAAQPLLTSLDFHGCGNLGSVKIANCPNIKTLSFDSTNISLNTLVVSSCEGLETIKILAENGYTYIPTIEISNCESLTTIQITNLDSTYNSSGNSSITLTGLPNLTTLNLSYDKFSRIIWDATNDPTTQSFKKLSTLNLSYSDIKFVGDENSTLMDLSGFSKIPSFSCLSNTEVEYVKFNNTPPDTDSGNRNAFGLGENAFRGCSKLQRVYGNISLNGRYIFRNCPLFSILGREITEYNGVNIKEPSGKIIHPYGTEMTVNNDSMMAFLEGENVTNLTFGTTTGAYQAFYQCKNLTEFDVYYALFNIGTTATSLYQTFYDSGSYNFGWTKSGTNEVDNSLSRYTFINCGKITTIYNLFKDCSFGGVRWRMFSPKKDNDSQSWVGGLLTPLVSCKNMDRAWPGSYFCDKDVLRSKNPSIKFKWEEIQLFRPLFVYNGVGDENTSYDTVDEIYQIVTKTSLTAAERATVNSNPNVGDVGGFLSDCPNVSTITGLLYKTRFINYNSVSGNDSVSGESNNFGITNKVTGMSGAFTSNYGKGDFVLGNIFTDLSKISNISGSFIVSYGYSDLRVYWELNDNTFVGMTSLTRISYVGTIANIDSGSWKNGETSFSGTGFHKFIDIGQNEQKDFPYDILNNCPNKSNITEISSLFNNVGFENSEHQVVGRVGATMVLPGRLFRGCSSLTNIPGFFYDFGAGIEDIYTLDYGNKYRDDVLNPDYEPFRDCVKLENVSYIFANRDDRRGGITGMIPYRLFYHGAKTVSRTIVGTNYEKVIDGIEILGDKAYKLISTVTGDPEVNGDIEITTEKYEYTNFIETETTGEIRIKPTTTVKKITTIIEQHDNGDPDDVSTTQESVNPYSDEFDGKTVTYTYSYEQPNATIKNMSCAFRRVNLDYYSVNGTWDEVWENEGINAECSTSNYAPFKYVKEGNIWKASAQNTNRYSFIWKFDGDYASYKEFIDGLDIAVTAVDNNGDSVELPATIEFLDVIPNNDESLGNLIDTTSSTVYLPGGEGITNMSQYECDGHFICSPDLLRYCTAGPTITYLFYGCGPNTHSFKWSSSIFVQNNTSIVYGIKGRIPPYLLKPVPSISSLYATFYDCKWLGYYIDNGKAYVIPKDFFTYVTSTTLTLTYAFRGLLFPGGIDLNVFNFPGSSKRNLYVERIFYYSWFKSAPGSNPVTNISGVFSDSKLYIKSLARAFQCGGKDNNINKGDDQYANFSSVFRKGGYNKTGDTSDWYVFYGHNKFGTKTLSQEANRCNYAESGGTNE